MIFRTFSHAIVEASTWDDVDHWTNPPPHSSGEDIISEILDIFDVGDTEP